MIRADPIGYPTLDQIGRDIGLIGIDKAGNDLIIPIQLRNRLQLILIQETLHQDAIDLLDNPTVLPIEHIVDDRARGERHCPQISQHIVVILRGLTGGGLVRRLAVGRVDVRVYPIDQQAVYRKYPSLAPFSPSLASL